MCCGALAMAPVPAGLQLGQPQVWPVRLRMGLALLWEGALAGKEAAWAWLPEGAEEGIQGGPAQAAASSKEHAVPVVTKDPSVGYMREPPCIKEALQMRSVEASAVCC